MKLIKELGGIFFSEAILEHPKNFQFVARQLVRPLEFQNSRKKAKDLR